MSPRPSFASTPPLLDRSRPQTLIPFLLLIRFVCLAALFVVELIAVSVTLDTQALDGRSPFLAAIGDFGPHLLQALVVFASVFTAFGYVRARRELARISGEMSPISAGWYYLAAHVAAMCAFAALSAHLFGSARGPLDDAIAVLWIATGVVAIAAAAFFFVPPRSLRDLLRNTGSAWIYAAAAACATPVFALTGKHLWQPATAATFHLAKFFLWPFVSTVTADPSARILGTPKFSVRIAPSCSGLEGMGLMLVFGALWLAFFHRDFRFPRALLLIPVGMGLIFLLNAVRIAALIMIGNAGAGNIALGGFHSQAGWIVFNLLALAMASLASRIPWLSSRPQSGVVARRTIDNPTAAYLLPFLAILAAAMISTAASGGFEWLYPLRFVAAAVALWVFRRSYSRLDWRFGWIAPLIGGMVFLLWIALDRLTGIPDRSAMPSALAAWPSAPRTAWLACRTLAAVITVPIAEELAFRGYLLRRLISPDFESVGFERWTWLAVIGSSILFGLMHGDRWIAGTAAGILYAAAQKGRGRIGDAVAAHGITNALIAVWVLWGGHWSFW